MTTSTSRLWGHKKSMPRMGKLTARRKVHRCGTPSLEKGSPTSAVNAAVSVLVRRRAVFSQFVVTVGEVNFGLPGTIRA